jgi:hypothetical protein
MPQKPGPSLSENLPSEKPPTISPHQPGFESACANLQKQQVTFAQYMPSQEHYLAQLVDRLHLSPQTKLNDIDNEYNSP